MCRFAVYVSPQKPILLADLLTRPTHSIVKQSYDCKERTVYYAVPASINADGFGIAWYPLKSNNNNNNNKNNNPFEKKKDDKSDFDLNEGSCLFRSVLPAWNDKNLHRISEKIESSLVFAHVRAASLGSVISQPNCHPFVYDKYTFMHNGGIGSFSKLKKHIVMQLSSDYYKNIQGTTDSEHAFMMFLNHLPKQIDKNSFQEPQILLKALKKTVVNILYLQQKLKVEAESTLNFAVSDGNTTLVSRIYINSKINNKTNQNEEKQENDNENKKKSKAASLYFSCGSMWAKCSDNEYRMRHTNMNEDVVIIASERLSMCYEDWVEVPHNHIVLISNKTNVLLFPINIDKELEKFKNDKSTQSIHLTQNK